MIRKLNKNNLADLKIIANQQFTDELNSINLIINCFENNNYIYFGKEKDNIIVSFLVALNSVDEVNILAIATKEEYKNKGYAKQLINKLIEENPNKTLFLEVKSTNIPAINLYNSLGFKLEYTRKNYYKNNVDALCMFLKK